MGFLDDLGLLARHVPGDARNALKGLLGDMPLTKALRGESEVSANGLKNALMGMQVGPDAQGSYDAAMQIGPQAMGGLLGKIVYHGSPHKWDVPDASKIGTGEGAQAYGHGLYWADAEGTGRTYKNMAPPEVVIGDQRISGKMGTAGYGDPVTKAWNEVTAAHGGQYQNPFATAKEWLSGKYGPRNKVDEEAIKIIEDWQRRGAKVEEGGFLYKADLPDEWIPKMLDWDKPIAEQGKALAELDDAINATAPHPRYNTAQTAINFLSKKLGGPDAAAKHLQSLGIPGIRYLDGGSRPNSGRITMLEQTIANLKNKGASKAAIANTQHELDAELARASYNYVVFPGLEDKVKILERNGVPLDGLLGLLGQ